MKALMYLVVNEYTNAVNIIEKKQHFPNNTRGRNVKNI